MERRFEKELEDLKANLVKMGRIVDKQIDLACHALFQGDVDLARQVQHKDENVDELDTLIDRQCQEIFALSQPVAVDLLLFAADLRAQRFIALDQRSERGLNHRFRHAPHQHESLQQILDLLVEMALHSSQTSLRCTARFWSRKDA